MLKNWKKLIKAKCGRCSEVIQLRDYQKTVSQRYLVQGNYCIPCNSKCQEDAINNPREGIKMRMILQSVSINSTIIKKYNLTFDE